MHTKLKLIRTITYGSIDTGTRIDRRSAGFLLLVLKYM